MAVLRMEFTDGVTRERTIVQCELTRPNVPNDILKGILKMEQLINNETTSRLHISIESERRG